MAQKSSEEDPWEVAGGGGELPRGGGWLSLGTFTLHPETGWVCCAAVHVLEPHTSHTGVLQLRNLEGEERGEGVRWRCEPWGAH